MLFRSLARDTKTGREKKLALSSAVDVSDEAVEAMIADSLEHAFEDMSERVWTETRLKSEEMLVAIRQAFALAGDCLPQQEKEHIEQLAGEVRIALSTHETTRLKIANDALDEATQKLAAIVLELVMSFSGSHE